YNKFLNFFALCRVCSARDSKVFAGDGVNAETMHKYEIYGEGSGGTGDYPYAEPDDWFPGEAEPPNVSNFERGLSIGLGALLVYSAVRNFTQTPLRSLLRSGLGAWMIVRGASGNCQ